MSTPIGESAETTTRWLTVASGMAVREGEVASAMFEGEEVALYRIGGLVYASD